MGLLGRGGDLPGPGIFQRFWGNASGLLAGSGARSTLDRSKCRAPRPPASTLRRGKTMNRGEAASFAELVKRYSVMVASDLLWHVKGCRRPMTKCHSCQLVLLRATMHCRNRLEEKKAPVEKVVEKVRQVESQSPRTRCAAYRLCMEPIKQVGMTGMWKLSSWSTCCPCPTDTSNCYNMTSRG